MYNYDFFKVWDFASEYHEGQTYGDDGDSYLVHLENVRFIVSMDYLNEKSDISILDIGQLKTIALLHDILEDTSCNYKELVDVFGEDIANSVLLLTKDEGFDYEEYIRSIITSKNNYAFYVKLADLKSNYGNLYNMKDEKRKKRLTNKYENAYMMMVHENIQDGINETNKIIKNFLGDFSLSLI